MGWLAALKRVVYTVCVEAALAAPLAKAGYGIGKDAIDRNRESLA